MRLIRFAAQAVAVALFLGVSVQSAVAQPARPGGSCLRLNSTTMFQGKKLTCVRNAKKLVWNTVSKPALNIDSPIPKSELGTLSDKIVAKYLESKTRSPYLFDVTFCPGINKAKANETIAVYQEATKFWSNFYVPKNPVKWIMFGNSDYNCWLATVTKVEGPNGDTKVWDPVTNVMGHCQLSDTAFCGYGTGVKSDGSFIQYNAIGKNFSGTPVGEVVFHEVVHFYQMAMQSDLSASGFRPDFPAWFTEGQANLFGMTIAAQGENAPQRNKAISEIKATITGAESFSESQWLSKLEELETNSGFVSQNGLGYSLGWLILEDFYQKYSFDQMNDLLTKLCIGETWGSALRLALGDSKEEIYTHVAKYLADQVK